jgi:hypothetical protein
MASVSAQARLSAPAAQVWDRIGDFNGVPQWHPAIDDSRLEHGGQVRRVAVAGDGQTVERLLSHDDTARRYRCASRRARCRYRTTGPRSPPRRRRRRRRAAGPGDLVHRIHPGRGQRSRREDRDQRLLARRARQPQTTPQVAPSGHDRHLPGGRHALRICLMAPARRVIWPLSPAQRQSGHTTVKSQAATIATRCHITSVCEYPCNSSAGSTFPRGTRSA